MKASRDRVERDSRFLNNLFFASRSQDGKAPLFIDMGSNLGQEFEFFSEYYTPGVWDYVLIEPSPACVRHLKQIIPEKISQIKKVFSSPEYAKLLKF